MWMLILTDKGLNGLKSLIMLKKLNKLSAKMAGAPISILERGFLRVKNYIRGLSLKSREIKTYMV